MGVLIDPAQLRRIGRGIERIERLQLPDDRQELLPLDLAVRAVLIEPLYPHRRALANLSDLQIDSQVFDVQVAGDPGENGHFRLKFQHSGADYVSDPIRYDAQAHEVRSAIATWPISPADLFISGGAISPELIPPEFETRARVSVTARWELAFVGPFFENPPVISVAADNTGGASLVITQPANWYSTGHIFEVIEAGLISDPPQSFYRRTTPLVPGAAIVAVPSRHGYLVTAAEARKYRGPFDL